MNEENPLLGIEPSAIPIFRDEYVDLADDDQFAAAKELSGHVFLIDEFIAAEMKAGRLDKTMFTKETRRIKLHGHCQQKALSSVSHSVTMLSFPENYSVETIPSGCCGMAGSFDMKKNTIISPCRSVNWCYAGSPPVGRRSDHCRAWHQLPSPDQDGSGKSFIPWKFYMMPC